ncbi:MAG: galactose-1-phosphate uridylyltransferase [Acidimicrobiales bacterium]
MTSTLVRLSDGRELRYYDREPSVDRSAPDRRALEPTHTASELRLDRLVDEWVIVASHRQGRTNLPTEADCPLCPSTPGHSTEIPAADYEVVVFENRFPSLDPAASMAPGTSVASNAPAADGHSRGDAQRRPGRGHCEVVCFTSEHHTSFSRLSPEQAATVLAAWTDRSAALAAMEGTAEVFIFENRGPEIGATVSHPHGQIYAYPFVTPRAERRLRVAAAHHGRTGRCLRCDVMAFEEANGERVVSATPTWLAYVPEAARWPFEVHLVPRRHTSRLGDLDSAEQEELCRLYLDVLGRLDGLFGEEMPYIAGWHQAPMGSDPSVTHLSMEVFSIRRSPRKLKFLAGSESAEGAFINDIVPEHAAELLRMASPASRNSYEPRTEPR